MTPPSDSNPIPDDEDSEPKLVQIVNEEPETQDETSESFWLRGPNEQLSQDDQSDEEATSSGDSTMLSPLKELRRRFMPKEKGKQKLSGYETGNVE